MAHPRRLGGASVVEARPASLFGDAETELSVAANPRGGGFLEAGKGHAELVGADIVATYAANATSFSMLVEDTDLYYPRFVRMTLR